METIQGFDFFRLHFNKDGNPTSPPELEDWKNHARNATDAILIAHGFRNDEKDAVGLYTKFLTTFREHVDGSFKADFKDRRFVVGAVLWPSKAFKEGNVFGDGSTQSLGDKVRQKESLASRLADLKNEEPSCAEQMDRAIALLDHVEGSTAKQDEFVKAVLSVLDSTALDEDEGVARIRSLPGSSLLAKFDQPILLPTRKAPRSDEGGVTTVGSAGAPGTGGGVLSIGSFFGSIFGRIDQVLNVTTWYIMKNRSGFVGANGVAAAVRALKQPPSDVRVHLVGHSLGGRLMASCAKSLTAAPQVKPRSLTLLEAAFSHYGFSANNGKGSKGFFREVVAAQGVDGPLVATFSAKDTVVGTVYAIASRLADDNTKAVGDARDQYGGIGRNGAQKTDEARTEPLRTAGSDRYTFETGKVVNLDGSHDLINNHGDVTNPHVTFAFACAVAKT